MTALNNDKLKIITAFRKYTRLGLASNYLSPFVAYRRIRGVSRNITEAYDLLAVYDTVRFLKFIGKDEVLKAVEAIYLTDYKSLKKRNAVSMRVIRYAYEINYDERTVYRQLEYARKIYSEIRKSYKQ